MDETNPLDPVQAAKEHVKGVADELHSAAGAKATQFQNVVEDAYSDARSWAQSWQTEVAKYIQQKPTKAVFMALGVGFVLSRRLRK
jgi:ElaB/YqjD/DUF883 family membrane-anchored ribosome-binding protein